MKYIVLRAISMPATLFWVPYKVAGLNIALMSLLSIVGVLTYDLNPLLFIFLLLGSHFFLVSWAAKEPHLDTLLEAWSFAQRPTKNLIKTKGKKYLP